MNGSSFIKEIGRSYIVSSFLPAALFVFLAIFLFRDFIPFIFSFQLFEINQLSASQAIILIVLTSWVAFYLYSSVDWTMKLYEGYFFRGLIKKWLVKLQRKRWHNKISSSYDDYIKLKNKFMNGLVDEKDYEEAYNKAYADLGELELKGPIDPEYLLPTRLGNILRASELYPRERYEIEGITLWNRLFHVLPQSFLQHMEEKNNHLLFLLNSSFLVIINASICIFIGLIGLLCQTNLFSSLCLKLFGTISLFHGFLFISPLEYIFIAALLFFVGYILYRIAVNAAEDYTFFIRAGFDLYRFNLLRQLNQKIPENLQEEKATWETLTQFFVVGNRLGINDIELDYCFEEKNE